MTTSTTVIRSMHDVGSSVWCGGALMGAIGLNSAANQVRDNKDRGAVASAVLGAVQGEHQRPSQVLKGLLHRS